VTRLGGGPLADPPQLDKLVISQLGLLAQRRLARGVKLNQSEATVGTWSSWTCDDSN
jgi:urease gamma subunit